MEEAGRMLLEGATPVTGEVVDGLEPPPPADPFSIPVGPPADGEPLPSFTPPAPDAIEVQERESPYLRFGERIRVDVDETTGEELITKPYPLPIGKAKAMLDLIQVLRPFDFRVITLEDALKPFEPLGDHEVEFLVLERWDTENLTDPVKGPAAMPAPQPVALSDLLVATARYDMLEEVEDFINLFAAGVRQIEVEAKIVEVVETDTTDIGIKSLDGMPIFDFPAGVFVDSLTFDLPNSADPNEALLTLGAIQDGTAFNAVLEALESFGNVSIDQKPKVAVREGVAATISSTIDYPYYEFSGYSPGTSAVDAKLVFKPVGIELYVTPRVIGTSTLALDVHVLASQVVGSVVTFVADNPIESPQIASRTARTVVYLKPGQALIIGGLTSERAVQRVSRVPILGQIPILGLLFQSKFDSIEKSYAMFVISPRIIQSNEFNAQL